MEYPAGHPLDGEEVEPESIGCSDGTESAGIFDVWDRDADKQAGVYDLRTINDILHSAGEALGEIVDRINNAEPHAGRTIHHHAHEASAHYNQLAALLRQQIEADGGNGETS